MLQCSAVQPVELQKDSMTTASQIVFALHEYLLVHVVWPWLMLYSTV